MTSWTSGAGRRVSAQARFETAAVLRNGEQLLLTFVLPLLGLVLLLRTQVGDLGTDRPAAALAGILALAVVSTALTSQAIVVAFDRRWGVLRLLATTPLGPRGLLGGKLLAVLAVLTVQTAALVVLALALGWAPALGPRGVAAAVGLVLLGAAAFVSLALLIGGTLRPEAVLAVANLLWVLLAAGGGLVLPVATLPGPLAAAVVWLPSGALGEGLRAALTGGAVPVPSFVVLAAWAAVGSWLAARFFRWD